jgi:hypothetical protein
VLELVRGGAARAYFNWSAEPQPMPETPGKVVFRSESVRYGAAGDDASGTTLRPYECVVTH